MSKPKRAKSTPKKSLPILPLDAGTLLGSTLALLGNSGVEAVSQNSTYVGRRGVAVFVFGIEQKVEAGQVVFLPILPSVPIEAPAETPSA